ncbi:archaea-specific SMC-related protein [Halorhabdus rudnickae]|uniref:archaea-specific SMC-related protein n=1 Tax=Halorhabdus rudnickae TaxID=1775544 RepID=UPI001083BF2A|nr:archaea-specific SMC-related protein [Halorhabdus rudnickae]
MTETGKGRTATVEIKNIGGIERLRIEFDEGTTLLSGENATNRTSILRAIAGVFGSDLATLNASADDGFVRLSLDGESYTRRLRRTESGTVRFEGDPYLDDATAPDLFAFLLANNETRQTVVTEGNLRDIVMEPIDLTAIEREITELRDELDGVDEQIERREHLQNERLPDLRSRRDHAQTEYEEVEAELETRQRELAAADRDVAESRSQREAVDETLSELKQARNERQETEQELTAERKAVQAAKERLADIKAELRELDPLDADRDELQRERSELWDRKEQLEDQIEQLQTLIDFNEEFRTDDASLFDAIESAIDVEAGSAVSRGEQLTKQLHSPDEEALVCWTCGQTTSRAEIEETVDALDQYRASLYEEYTDVDERIEAIETKIERLDEQRATRDRLVERRERTQQEIDRTERTIESLVDRKTGLSENIDDLEEKLASLETDEGYQRVIDRHKEVNELEVERDALQERLTDLEDEIETVEAELSELSDLEATRSEIREELQERRTRIERLEQRTIETFNEHMEALLERLDFANIERVWLERKEQSSAGRGDTETVFDLHVVRSHDDGTVFEDSVQHLSESERQVVALVFALAGNLAHEVHEKMPFMLLDSMEMIDATRKARLLEYFAQYHAYLIAVVLFEELDPVLDELGAVDVIEVTGDASELTP